MELIRAEIAGGNLGRAEDFSREFVIENPNDVEGITLFATLLMARGALGEAETILASVAATSAAPTILRLRATIQYQRQEFEECIGTLKRIIEANPHEALPQDFHRLAKLTLRTKGENAARQVLRGALSVYPDDVELILSYSDLLSDRNAAFAELAERLPLATTPAHASKLLKRMTLCRVACSRGPSAPGSTWADTCIWPDPAGLERLRRALTDEVSAAKYRTEAVLDLACIAIAHQNWRAAQKLLERSRKSIAAAALGGRSGTYADYAAFGDDFHHELDRISDGDILAALPNVNHVVAQSPASPEGIFLASDLKYFYRFTAPLLQQLDARRTTCQFHVHVFDCTDSEASAIAAVVSGLKAIRVGVSTEDSQCAKKGVDYARTYYHAVRFIRLYQHLKATRRKTWILDVDAHVNKDASLLVTRLADFDLAIRTNPCGFEPNFKITASCVGVSPTVRGLAFLRRVAAYVHFWKQRERWGWGIDQVALFSSYAYLHSLDEAPRTLFLDQTAISMNDETDGVFLHQTGIRKYGASGA